MNSFLALPGVKWRLRNGKKIKIWLDVWAHEKPLLEFTRGAVPEQILGTKVSDFWQVGKAWDLSSLDYLLPSSILMTLAGFIVSEEEGRDDEVMWGRRTTECSL